MPLYMWPYMDILIGRLLKRKSTLIKKSKPILGLNVMRMSNEWPSLGTLE